MQERGQQIGLMQTEIYHILQWLGCFTRFSHNRLPSFKLLALIMIPK